MARILIEFTVDDEHADRARNALLTIQHGYGRRGDGYDMCTSASNFRHGSLADGFREWLNECLDSDFPEVSLNNEPTGPVRGQRVIDIR